jgi:hypothetical protein
MTTEISLFDQIQQGGNVDIVMDIITRIPTSIDERDEVTAFHYFI